MRIIHKHRETCKNASADDNIQIMSDRTFKERQEHVKLAKESDERNKNLDEREARGKK